MADGNKEKLIEQCSQDITRPQDWSRFAESRDANLLYTVVAAPPIPPKAENTRGVNEPISLDACVSKTILRCVIQIMRSIYFEDRY